MVVQIDEPWSNDHARDINGRLTSCGPQLPDFGDATVANADVAAHARPTGSIDNRPANEEKTLSRRSLRQKNKNRHTANQAGNH